MTKTRQISQQLQQKNALIAFYLQFLSFIGTINLYQITSLLHAIFSFIFPLIYLNITYVFLMFIQNCC